MKVSLVMFLAAGVFSCGWIVSGQDRSEPVLLEGEQVCSLPAVEQEAGTALFSPDGSRLLVCGRDLSILWEIPSGRKIASLRHRPAGAPSSWLNHFSFSACGTRILAEAAAINQDGYFYTVWDATAGTPLGETRIFSRGSVGFRNLLSPDGSLFLEKENGKSWMVHDVTAEGISLSFRSIPARGWHVEYSPDSSKAAFFGPDGCVSVWDLVQGKELWNKPGGEKGCSVDVVRFSKDSTAVFVADQEGECAEIHDLKLNRTLAKTENTELRKNFPCCLQPFSLMYFNPENKKMRKVGLPLSIMRRKWKEVSGRLINLPGPEQDSDSGAPPEIVYVTRNGCYAVMAECSGCQMYNYEPQLLIWDAKKNRMVGDVVYWPPFIVGLIVSPGENYLYFTADNGAREGIVPLSTGMPMKVPGKILAFAADDSMIAWLDGKKIRVWKLPENGQSDN